MSEESFREGIPQEQPEEQHSFDDAIELAEKLMTWADNHLDAKADDLGVLTRLQMVALAISLLYAAKDEFDLDLVCTLLLARLAQIIKAAKMAGLSDETIMYGKPTEEEVQAEIDKATVDEGGES